VAKVKK